MNNVILLRFFLLFIPSKIRQQERIVYCVIAHCKRMMAHYLEKFRVLCCKQYYFSTKHSLSILTTYTAVPG